MSAKDYYAILGVSDSATQEEIKRAYRAIAKENHPDRNPGDKAAEERFKAAQEAYDTLGNEEKRKKYDQLRKLGAGGGFGGFGGFRGFGGGAQTRRRTTAQDDTAFEIDYEDFMRRYGGRAQQGRGERAAGTSLEDLLGGIFGGRSRAQEEPTVSSEEPQPTSDPFFKRKGNDAYVDLDINLAQALLGSKVRVRTPQEKKVTVKIPAGTDPDKVLRVSGMGYASVAGTGDLYIRFNLVMPKNLTPEQRAAAEEFAERLGLKH